MARAYISVGSNIDAERNVRSAIAALRARYGTLILSTVYETDTVGFQGPPFYNLAVGFDTDEDPRALVRSLHAVEDAHGRTRTAPRYSSRSLDLDLLLYDDLVLHEPGLKLPRPDLARHAFILGPIAEIAGDLHHPTSGRPLRDLWEALGAQYHTLRPLPFRPADPTP